MANKLVEINADMFIIPNSAMKIKDFFWYRYIDEKEYARKDLAFYKNLYTDNNKEFNDDDFYPQIWLTNNEFDNIIRHGFAIDVNGGRYFIDNSNMSLLENCPRCLIDIKEGETATVLVRDIKATNGFGDNAETIMVDIMFHLTANQHEYRYRNFGTFEEVLRRVCH